MKFIIIIFAAIIFAGCFTPQPRYEAGPMKLYCGMPKAMLVEKITAAFVANGYDIKLVSTEAGTVQAESNPTIGGSVDYVRHIWSIAVKPDTMIVNARVVMKWATKPEESRAVDEHSGRDFPWFMTIMTALRETCSTTPLRSE